MGLVAFVCLLCLLWLAVGLSFVSGFWVFYWRVIWRLFYLRLADVLALDCLFVLSWLWFV